MGEAAKKPKYALETYRRFIREATSYVSLIVGRKMQASEADTIEEIELFALALQIDARVDDIKARRH